MRQLRVDYLLLQILLCCVQTAGPATVSVWQRPQTPNTSKGAMLRHIANASTKAYTQSTLKNPEAFAKYQPSTSLARSRYDFCGEVTQN